MSLAKFTTVESLFRSTLASGITSSQTDIELSDAPGALTGYPNWLVIEPLSSNYEIVYVPSAPSGSTFSSVVRGINPNSDADTNDSSFAKAHPANVDVILAPMHRHWNSVAHVMRGEYGTGFKNFRLGDETDSDMTIFAQNGDTNKPFIQYNASANKWYISNDGTSTYDITSGGSGLTRGLGVDISGSAITLDVRASGGIRNNQGTGSQQVDVDPTIVARLDTANTWGAVQSLTADQLQVTTDADSANDAVRKSFLDSTVDARLSSANATLLTGGPSSNASSLHHHDPTTFQVEMMLGSSVISTTAADFVAKQMQVGFPTDLTDFYIAFKDAAATNNRRVVRYQKDTTTGMYFKSASSDYNSTGGGAGANQYAGIGVGATYVYLPFINAGGADVTIRRFARDLTGTTDLTNSGTALTDVGHSCGDDTHVFVMGTSTSTTLAVYAISGTTATRGTNLTMGDQGQNILGMHFDGTYIYYITSTAIKKYDTSGTLISSLSRIFQEPNAPLCGIGLHSSSNLYIFSIQTIYDATNLLGGRLNARMVATP